MNYIVFDGFQWEDFLPLTYLRPVADLRMGIITFREKWELLLEKKTSSLTEAYLQKKYPLKKDDNNILLNGTVCPTQELVFAIKNLQPGQALVKNEKVLAFFITAKELDSIENVKSEEIAFEGDLLAINNLWDIFSMNAHAIAKDFELITGGRASASLSASNTIIGDNAIFVEEGVVAEAAVFNTSGGPIYLGKNSEVMEGSVIRGPFALLDHGVVKMNAKIYGGTTVGPYSKVGGELNNVVIIGYSNKAHDGFLGNSVIGEWCNLGADTNNSNLKNNYDNVKLWNYPLQSFVNTSLQFCGLIMGDHSKAGINTMFNTGTVVGISSNIFGAGFQRNFIPSFAWGGTAGFKNYQLEKAIEVIKRVYARRKKDFDSTEDYIIRKAYDLSYKYRRVY